MSDSDSFRVKRSKRTKKEAIRFDNNKGCYYP